jgi:hypothetical protein
MASMQRKLPIRGVLGMIFFHSAIVLDAGRERSEPSLLLEVDVAESSNSTSKCAWGELKCSCIWGEPLEEKGGVLEVSCKKWTTGVLNGREVCSSADLKKEDLGFKWSPHSPEAWNTGVAWI